ncbi:MAG: hypothetical protein AB7L09_01905 [Nitrospira sp.]
MSKSDKIIKLLPKDLVLGDEVRLFDTPFGWGTVVKITDEEVHIFRVYVHIHPVVYISGLLHYTGHELVTLPRDSTRDYDVDAYNHKRMSEPGALK